MAFLFLVIMPFKERYKLFSDLELVHVLNSPKTYQPLAVDAAKQELESRNLSKVVLENLKDQQC